jgi:UPF0288 family protein (methanogenesis marker protein 3)
MGKYLERADRVETAFPVEFATQEGAVTGHCVNISESGILGIFAKPLELWTTGELTFQFAGGLLGVKARVARVIGREAGLVFLFQHEDERLTVHTAIAFVRTQMELRARSSPKPPF